ncbi:MAG: restriction endonuclease subunit S [Terracidiphilus sp.]
MTLSWRDTPLSDCLEERRESPDPHSVLVGAMPLVGKVAFADGRIHLRPDSVSNTNLILVQPGDLLISGINASKGAIALQQYDYPVAATIHYSAYSFNKENVEPRYVWWFLRSEAFREIIRREVPGGIKSELRATRLLPLRIPLPPLPAQRAFAKVIDDVADSMAVARSHRVTALKSATLVMESALDHIMGRSQRYVAFGEYITLRPRSGPSFLTRPEWRGTPVLMPSSVTGFGVNTYRVEYGDGSERVSDKDRLLEGDILIARGNKRDQVGNAGVVPSAAKGWVCANLLMRLQVDAERIDPHFCIYWLRSPRMRSHVKLVMGGTSPNIQKINQKKILAFPFPADIGLREQKQAVAALDRLQAALKRLNDLQRQSRTELCAVLPSVLDRVFKGEL